MFVCLSESPSQQNVFSLAPTSRPIILTASNPMTRPTYPVVQRVPQQPLYVPQQLQQPQYLPQQPSQLQQTHFNPLDQAHEDQEENNKEEDAEPEDEEPVVAKVPKPRKARKKKDPNAPPAPLSAYAFFFRETQTKVILNIMKKLEE